MHPTTNPGSPHLASTLVTGIAAATVVLAATGVFGQEYGTSPTERGNQWTPADGHAGPVVSTSDDSVAFLEPPVVLASASNPPTPDIEPVSRRTRPAPARGDAPATSPLPPSIEHLTPAPHDPEAGSITTPKVPAPAEAAPSDDHAESTARTISDEMWDRLAVCESGYNGVPRWDVDVHGHLDPYSEARFYGGLQFNKMSWDWAVEVGGHDVPAWPHEATREQQIDVAETLRDIHPAGWGAWPVCSRKVGLR